MEKKKPNYFFIILGILFLVFLAYNMAFQSGYYEANISRKSKITEEKRIEFENDIKEGKEIDIKDYINNDFIDYSSSMSKIGNNLSSKIDSFMDNGLTSFFDFLGKLFT